MSVEKSKLPTLIESILRRAGGTIVTLGSTSYHFKPDAADRHVAQVEDEDHAERLLSIREGFREVEYLTAPLGSVNAPAPAPAPVPASQPAAPAADNAPTNTITPISIQDDGGSESGVSEPAGTGDDVANAGDPPTADVADPPSTAPAADVVATPVKTDEVVPDAKTAPTRDELVAAYQVKFGRKPHHQWSDEIIAAKLAEG